MSFDKELLKDRLRDKFCIALNAMQAFERLRASGDASDRDYEDVSLFHRVIFRQIGDLIDEIPEQGPKPPLPAPVDMSGVHPHLARPEDMKPGDRIFFVDQGEDDRNMHVSCAYTFARLEDDRVWYEPCGFDMAEDEVTGPRLWYKLVEVASD